MVLPRDRGEVEGVLKAAQRQGVPFMVRGNGSSVMGFVMTDGLVIDTQRMKRIVFDCDTWSVTVGAGVSAFELQQAARRRGYRVNVAEPAALVCANLMCSGIMSLFGTSYGTLDDNYVDAEFGDASGNAFHLNDRSAPNLYCFTKEDRPSPGICTSARIKLHPTSADETGALVPFQQLDEALRFVRELSAAHRHHPAQWRGRCFPSWRLRSRPLPRRTPAPLRRIFVTPTGRSARAPR